MRDIPAGQGVVAHLAGRVYPLEIPRSDGIPNEAVFNWLNIAEWGIDLTPYGDPIDESKNFLPMETYANLATPSMNPVMIWREDSEEDVATRHAIALADPEVRKNEPAAFTPGDKVIKVRLAGWRRDMKPGWNTIKYVMGAVGGTADWPGDEFENLNLIRVEPSTVLANRRVTIEVLGAELAEPGEIVPADDIHFYIAGTDVTAPPGTHVEDAPNKIIVHGAVGAYCSLKDGSGKPPSSPASSSSG